MQRITLRSTIALLALAQLATSCAKDTLKDASLQPQQAVSQNATINNSGQVPIDAVEFSNGINNRYYFRVASLEPSGGNKIYTWKSTADNNDTMQPAGYPNAATYVSSPGAISIAGRDDSEQVIIVTNSNDIYFQNGSSWQLLDGQGLKFLAIATRDFQIQGSGSSVYANGLLYAIAGDHLVYKLDTNTLNWIQVGGDMQVANLTVDIVGRPWVVNRFVKSLDPDVPSTPGGKLYRGTGSYGQAFGSWAQYATPNNAPVTALTTTDVTNYGLAITTSNGNSIGKIYWMPLPSGNTANPYQVIFDNNNFNLINIYGGGHQDRFWFSSVAGTGSSGNGVRYVIKGQFNGL